MGVVENLYYGEILFQTPTHQYVVCYLRQGYYHTYIHTHIYYIYLLLYYMIILFHRRITPLPAPRSQRAVVVEEKI